MVTDHICSSCVYLSKVESDSLGDEEAKYVKYQLANQLAELIIEKFEPTVSIHNTLNYRTDDHPYFSDLSETMRKYELRVAVLPVDMYIKLSKYMHEDMCNG